MKKLILTFMIVISSVITAKSQIYSAQLRYFTGIGNIFYPNGYYRGDIIQGVANGTGTFYFVDGSFIHGTFTNGLQNGPAVIVSPNYGYVLGCWNLGVYLGPCQYNNPYDSDQKVQQIVTHVQASKPANNNYTSVDPDGYKITKIDPDTELGHSLLGSYHN